jgi:hypothetical protein
MNVHRCVWSLSNLFPYTLCVRTHFERKARKNLHTREDLEWLQTVLLTRYFRVL